MKINKWIGSVAGLLLAGNQARSGSLRLPNLFANHMVIQRQAAIHLWGSNTPNATARITLGHQQTSVTADANGAWLAALPPVPVGGPYQLTITSGADTLVLTDILCGDMWLCSGQSNMQLPVREVNAAEQQSLNSPHPGLRLCSVAKAASAKPELDAAIQWREASPEVISNFSAVAYFFAEALRQDPALRHVPIGLVDSSFGGTTCEGWIPPADLAAFNAKDLHDSMFGFKPGTLHNGMIAPLGSLGLKGVLWYQGESNSAHPDTYPALLQTMISSWRRQFQQPELPFLVIQLPDYAQLWEGWYWPWIREAQARAARTIPHTALVVGLGTTSGYNLHPTEKQELGRRAALVARQSVYGENIAAVGPEFRSAAIEGTALRVHFDTHHRGLVTSIPDSLDGFQIAGADGNYFFADARIEQDSVVVCNAQVPEPKTVRYAWAGMPHATLTDRAGRPAAPFRTDTLPCRSVEVQAQQPDHRVATAAYEVAFDANGKMASLIKGGAQFLSGEPGAAGGSSIPGFWGPRPLTQLRIPGPDALAFSDGEVTLQLEFAEQSFTWEVNNAGKAPIQFQLALSPFAKAAAGSAAGSLEVARGSTTLVLDGFETNTNTPTGTLLQSTIPAAGTRRFTAQ